MKFIFLWCGFLVILFVPISLASAATSCAPVIVSRAAPNFRLDWLPTMLYLISGVFYVKLPGNLRCFVV